MARITTEGTPVALLSGGSGIPTTFPISLSGHLLLVFEDNAGNEFVIRGGPTGEAPNYGPLTLEINEPIESSIDIRIARDKNGTPILDEDGNVIPVTPESRGSTLVSFSDGRLAQDVWQILRQHAVNIDIERLPYSPTGFNSNGTAANLLDLVGIDINNVLPNPTGFMALPYVGKNIRFEFDYTITGTERKDKIIGRGGIQEFLGNEGDDTLSGGQGDDFLDGGEDIDLALYEGSFSDYEMSFLVDGSVVITDSVDGRDGSDLLADIEFAQFADRRVKLEPGLDIAFVIDTTGSMSGAIGAVKSSAKQIINSIFESDLNSRIAVVGYNDPGTNTFLSFTNQPKIEDRKSAAQNAINRVSANDGGDFPEAVNAGLIRALNGGAGEWRAEASARRIILFGDAPPKDTELRAQVLALAGGADVSVPSAPALAFASSEALGFAPLSITGDIETSLLSDGMALTSFALETADAEGSNVTVPVEIFTISINGNAATSTDFESLATATGGQAFIASASDLVEQIITAIEIPTGLYFTTDEDTSVVIPSAELLNSDTGEILSLVEINNSYSGTAVINTDGNLEFTPDTNFNGRASFYYTVTNGTDTSNRFADVIVNSVNDILILNDDTATTDEDTPITILASDLFANDINDDREDSQISGISNLAGGTAFIDSDGHIRFTPDPNFNGLASLNYTVFDPFESDTALLEIIVNSINDSPLASNDIISAIDEDTLITVLATELLSNDRDPDEDSLSIIEANSSDGIAFVNPDGNIEFTPAANFNGTASFNYTVTDGVDTSMAIVEFVVNPINDILIANDDLATTDEDTPVVILASDLFTNDINDDVEKSLNISQIINVVNGTAVLNAAGNVEFTPQANFNGTASFDYQVTDGTDIETAAVEIQVNPVNDAPFANTDTVTTDEDLAITISSAEILSNDSDLEGDSISFVSLDNVANGSVLINADGNIEFTPEENFNGITTFNYTVTDGTSESVGLVEIEVNPVNDAPVVTEPLPDIYVTLPAPDSIIELMDTFEDLEQGDFTRYRASASAILDINFDFSATRKLIVSYPDNSNTIYASGGPRVEVGVTDNEGETADSSFIVFFADSTSEADSLAGGDGNDYLSGLQGQDSLAGGNGDDTLKGDEDADTINGDAGADSLEGGSGNDILFGGVGRDTLLGGVDNDTIEGGGDSDTYIYNLGDGSDVISDYVSLTQISDGGSNDTLKFGEGITRDNLSWRASGEDLVFSFADAPNDSLTIRNYTDSNYLIENIEVEGSLLTAEEINNVFSKETVTIGEFGQVDNFDHNRQTIELSNDYVNPVVFALPLSRNGGDPAVVRITDIESNSFTAYVQEAEYRDGWHTRESFSYLVVEAGNWELEDGTLLEVGTLNTHKLTTEGWENPSFDLDFEDTPVILSQVQTNNGTQFVRTRQRGASVDGFLLSMEEEEALKASGHLTETVGWLAVESGQGDWGELQYQAGHTDNLVNHRGYSLNFDVNFESEPLLLASLASVNGGDSAGLRYRNLDSTQVNIMIEEDKSLDSETNHVNEIVDFLAISGTGDLLASVYEPVELI
ncbi:MAG: tandem-95 repeat protein [Cyanobacteria bacterium J06621_8]